MRFDSASNGSRGNAANGRPNNRKKQDAKGPATPKTYGSLRKSSGKAAMRAAGYQNANEYRAAGKKPRTQNDTRDTRSLRTDSAARTARDTRTDRDSRRQQPADETRTLPRSAAVPEPIAQAPAAPRTLPDSCRTQRPEVELLAPAGDPSCLHAAVTAGANAVYLGLDAFNARRNAQNFTLDAFAEACDYAHLRGVHIYVTLNTVIMQEETDRALELARQAWRRGADAFIVQDIGIATELRRVLPEARLHISTQMNTHNTAGMEAAALLGASRVTLAREMSVDEIADMVEVGRVLGLEVETFAHGALCICYSGQCLMSSLIGGRSANRGTCAQACRLPYELRNRALQKDLFSPGEHLLSPMDLCTINMLPRLLAAGVSSLKIEGRMKSPEYVFAVVSTYRAVLDRIAAQHQAGVPYYACEETASPQEYRVLSEAFSRGFTTAYMDRQRGNDIMSYQRPNNRGIAAGRIGRTDDRTAYLDADLTLSPGDVVEIWTGKGHVAHVLSELKTDGDGLVKIPLDRRDRADAAVRAGDRVFRVRSAAAAFYDDPLDPRIPVTGHVTLAVGQPARVEFSAQVAGETYYAVAEGSPVEPARTKAVTEDDVVAHVNRMGQTPFCLADVSDASADMAVGSAASSAASVSERGLSEQADSSAVAADALTVNLDPGVGIGFSTLHQLRAAALEDLQSQVLQSYAARRLQKAPERESLRPAASHGCIVAAWATNPTCARAAKRAGADVVYVPALNMKRGEAMVAGQRSSTVEQAGYPKAAVVALPTVDHDYTDGTREAERGFDVWDYVKEGKPVLVDSLGAAVRAADLGAQVEFGPHIPIANTLALDAAAKFGATRVWLSPELTLEQIRSLHEAGESVPLGLTIIGSQELMITEHCLLMSQGRCAEDCDACPRRKSPHVLRDRKGFEFPVTTDAFGRSHLYNSVQLDVAHAAPELVAAGISAFMVDTTLMNGEETAQAVGRAVRARDLALRDGNTVAKNSGTTSGHLFRGVE